MSQADDVVSEYFDNDEADLILRSSAPEDKPAMIFKVTKKQLRRASPVFDDMLELGQIDSSSSLAVVQLAESSTVLELFLRFLLKSGPERPQYDGSFDAKIFARLLEVYECCFKYETDLLAAFVEALLQEQAYQDVIQQYESVDTEVMQFYAKLCHHGVESGRRKLASNLALRCQRATQKYHQSDSIIDTLSGRDVFVLFEEFAKRHEFCGPKQITN